MSKSLQLCVAISLVVASSALAQTGLQSSDLLKLRSVSSVRVSPDGTRVAYTVDNNDGTGRPYGQLWVMTVADGKTVRFGGEKESTGNPKWSPDGQSIAYRGRVGDKSALSRGDVGHQQPVADHRRDCDVVARWQTHRVRLGRPRP
jgi:dipeptidyl aminopeptidase/acylaminoacyl peptidase